MAKGTGSWTVRIEGLDAANRKLRRLKNLKSLRIMEQSFIKSAGVVHKVAYDQAPERSGDLKRSMKYGGSRLSSWVRAGHRSNRDDRGRVPYAGPIHWGWRKRNIKPNEWYVRALKKSIPKVDRILEAGAIAVVKRLGLSGRYSRGRR